MEQKKTIISLFYQFIRRAKQGECEESKEHVVTEKNQNLII